MGKRLFYLDNLRAAATILVILHHAAITYGASGSWYYIEKTTSLFDSALLTLFAVINQSFFMGLFFFISGYFTPASYDKKGWRLFLSDRLRRLGIPLVVYILIIGPVLLYFLENGESTFADYYLQRLQRFDINWGPLWFVAALIYFSFVYVLWRFLNRSNKENNTNSSYPSKRVTALCIVFVGIAAFFIRIFIPVGHEVLGQQLGFFASYIFFYIAGIIAYRYGWLDALIKRNVLFWFKISLIFIIALPFIMIFGGALEGKDELFEGGLRMQALIYALWEPLVGFGIIMMLLFLFKDKYNISNTFLKVLTNSAYTAYIIHPPVLVFISYLFHGSSLPGVLKFVLVGFSATAAIFLLAFAITKLPYVKKVL